MLSYFKVLKQIQSSKSLVLGVMDMPASSRIFENEDASFLLEMKIKVISSHDSWILQVNCIQLLMYSQIACLPETHLFQSRLPEDRFLKTGLVSGRQGFQHMGFQKTGKPTYGFPKTGCWKMVELTDNAMNNQLRLLVN